MKGCFSARHPWVLPGTALGFGLFVNGFGFPVCSLNRGWPGAVIFCYLFLAVYTGGPIWLLTFVFPRRRCLLEWGRVFNRYNLTLLSIPLHLTAVSVLSLPGCVANTQKQNLPPEALFQTGGFFLLDILSKKGGT